MAEKNGGNHEHHEKRMWIFFWFSAFITAAHLANLTLEIFGKGPVSFGMTIFFLSVLSVYSGPNAVIGWKKEKGNRPGEFLALIVLTYTAVVHFFAVYLEKPEIVPGQLSATWGGVLIVLFGTKMPKIIKDVFGNDK